AGDDVVLHHRRPRRSRAHPSGAGHSHSAPPRGNAARTSPLRPSGIVRREADGIRERRRATRLHLADRRRSTSTRALLERSPTACSRAVSGSTKVDTDYLVIGAGALGMGFVDTLIENCDADVV